MLDTVKQLIFRHYKPTDIRGVFISAFSSENTLLASHGVVQTDKMLDQLMQTLYTSIIAPLTNIRYIIVDIVGEYQTITDMKIISSINCQEYGICVRSLSETKSGVLLPQTAGITNAIQALQYIKQKYALEGNVEISIFKTHRIVIRL